MDAVKGTKVKTNLKGGVEVDIPAGMLCSHLHGIPCSLKLNPLCVLIGSCTYCPTQPCAPHVTQSHVTETWLFVNRHRQWRNAEDAGHGGSGPPPVRGCWRAGGPATASGGGAVSDLPARWE